MPVMRWSVCGRRRCSRRTRPATCTDKAGSCTSEAVADYIVEIRAGLLDEIDCQMLQYGLKERHKLMVRPSSRAQ